MSTHDKLLREFNSRKFNTEELRFLLEKFKVRSTSSSRKKELAESLADVLLGKTPSSPRKVNRIRHDREVYPEPLLIFVSNPTQLQGQYIPDPHLEVKNWKPIYRERIYTSPYSFNLGEMKDYSYVRDALKVPAESLVNDLAQGMKALNKLYTYTVTIKGVDHKITLHAQRNGTVNGLPSFAIYIDSSDPLIGKPGYKFEKVWTKTDGMQDWHEIDEMHFDPSG